MEYINRMKATPCLVLALLLGSFVTANAQKTQQAIDKDELKFITGLDKRRLTTRAAFEKSPKDQKAKGAYLDAAFRYAEVVFVTPALPPKTKYPAALRAYRDIVKVEPKHKEAVKKIALIEGIYKSMNRPIPK